MTPHILLHSLAKQLKLYHLPPVPSIHSEKIPVPGAELLPTGTYEMTKTDLLEEIQPTGNSCLSGNVLYYSLSKSEDDFLDTYLYARDLTKDENSITALYPFDLEARDAEGFRKNLEGFFAAGDGTVWVAERYDGEKTGLRLRRLSADGTEHARVDVSEHLTAFYHGVAVGD